MAERQRILTINQIAKIGLDRFPADRYEVGPKVDAPDAILVRSQDLHAMAFGPGLKAIGRAGAGTNNIPVKALSGRGVPVFNAPGANANAVKELVIASMLLAARNLVPAIRFVSGLQGTDDELASRVEAGKKQFAGVELPGRTLGVIGLGKIGSLVADSAIKLGMNVLGYDPDITVDAAWSLPAQVRRASSIEDVLRSADFITVHVPLTEGTRNLISVERLPQLRPGAVILNFSREGIVDPAAVVAGVASGQVGWYISDFPASQLMDCERAVFLPHLGASTAEAEDNCAVMVAEQVRDYLDCGDIRNAVNFPSVAMPRESPYRVGIANANVPNMLGQISTTMAGAGLNIHNMLNKSRGEMAYTLVDVDSPVPAGVVNSLAAIRGVLAVRYLPAS